jgi:hypothetical protein
MLTQILRNPVSSCRWLVLICLFGAVMFFTIAPMDASDTVFNEIDTPVSVSHPALPQIRLNGPTIVARHRHGEPERVQHARACPASFEDSKQPLRPGDLQKLLCVFLI